MGRRDAVGELEFGVLGPLEVLEAGRRLQLGAAKERALLVLLLLEPGKVVLADRLIDELWGQTMPKSALASLRALVSRLRGRLGAQTLLTRGEGFALDIEPDQVDVVRFYSLAEGGREELEAGDAQSAAATLRDALGLWRGAPFSDASDSPLAQAEAAQLEEARLSVLEDRVEADLACGRHGAVVAELERLAATHPLRERLWSARMLALYRCRRQADALAAFTDLRERLVGELGIEPAPALRELQGRILAQDPGLALEPAVASPKLVASAPVGRGSGASLVTLLFTDLVGSTELLQELGDDAAEAVRRTHFRLLRDAVRSRGGEEIKNLGDGLMVVFDSAVEAVGCAVAMQQAVHRHNERSQEAGLGVRVGLNVGEPIRDEDDYFGTSVVVAKRLCDRADGGQILASALVEGLVGSRGGFEFRGLGELDLKGMSRPLAACEVAWEPAYSGPMALPPALTAGEADAFVGREDELGRLRLEWERSRGGGARLVLLVGEPGIGKTRLAGEFARACHGEGASVLFGRCYEEALAGYQPFVEALRHYVGAMPVDELRLQVTAQRSELQRLVPEVSERLPNLPAPLAGDPEGERYRLFDSVASLLGELSVDRPTLVYLDDLHWADEGSLQLLKHVLRAQQSSPLVILATCRSTELAVRFSELVADMRRDHLVAEVAVEGLSEAEVAALINRWAGEEVPADFARAVAGETEGNPFFIEEIVRHLTETGAIHREQGAWRSDLRANELGIPQGVREVIGRRLSRLGEGARRVLTFSAVLGREFDLELLEELSELSGDAPINALEEAMRAQLIEEDPGRLGRYRFAHALIRETLYQALSRTRRVRLHREIAALLERHHADEPASPISELAYHFYCAAPGSQPDQAIRHLMRAGAQATTQLAYEEASVQYARALELLGGTHGRDHERCHVSLELGEARWRSGDATQAKDAYREAADLARSLAAPELFARAALGCGLGTGGAGFAISSDASLVELLEEALRELGTEDSALRARVLSRLAVELYFTPSIERRTQLSTEAVQIAERLNDPPARLIALYSRHWSSLGPDLEIEERLAIGTEIVELASAIGDLEMAYRGHHIRMRTLLDLGDIAGTDVEISACARLAEELREPFYAWQTGMFRALRMLYDGRLRDGEQLALKTLEMSQRGPTAELARTAVGAQLALVMMLTGRLAELRPRIEAFATGQPWNVVWRAGLPYILSELELYPEARSILDELALDEFATLPRDGNWLASLWLLSLGCRRLGDGERAEILYRLLGPFADRIATTGTGSFVAASCAQSLGVLAGTAGHYDSATAHFEAALDSGKEGPVWNTWTRHEYAWMLIARGRSKDRQRAAQLIRSGLKAAGEMGMQRTKEQLQELQAQLMDSAADRAGAASR
jgi:DNA-binding SARP family transcriptional activator/tetratricopeptide (TPR) repeat protein